MSEAAPANVPQLVMRLEITEDPVAPVLPDGMIFRRATAGDEEALAFLLSRAFEQRWTGEAVARNLTRNPGVDSVLCIDAGPSLAATASARIGDGAFRGLGYLHWVGVDPSARRMGLGRAVSVGVLRRFREMGFRCAVLETDDFRLDAIRMYLGLGFRPEVTHGSHAERWKVIDATLARRTGDLK